MVLRGKGSHRRNFSKNKEAPQVEYQGKNMCYNCGITRHISREYSKRQKIEQPSGGTQNVRHGHVYNLTCEDAEADPAVIEGTLFFSDTPIHALIDPGSTHSFISYAMACSLKFEQEKLGCQMIIATLMGTTIETIMGCRECNLKLGGEDFRMDLALLEIQDFNMIVSMDSLSLYNAKIDCKGKSISSLKPNAWGTGYFPRSR